MLIDDFVKKLTLNFDADDYLFQREDGTYLLTLSPEQTVEMIPQQMGFRLRCDVGACPPKKTTDLITTMMLANLLGQGTGKSHLSLSVNEQRIYLNRDLEWEMAYVEFTDELEAFLNFADYWRKKISSWPS